MKNFVNYFKFNIEKSMAYARIDIWILTWHKCLYFPRWARHTKMSLSGVILNAHLFSRYKYFHPFLIVSNCTIDSGKVVEISNSNCFGIAFWYKGHQCRTAVRIKEGFTPEAFHKAWKKLSKALMNPENPETKVVFDGEVLVGKEMCI